MILVLAGTQDGRELTDKLAHLGLRVMVSVVSDYGRQLAESGSVIVNACPLTLEGFIELIRCQGIDLVLDASHPYAVNVSHNAMAACEAAGIKYLRYERPAVSFPAYQRLHIAGDCQSAAKAAADLGRVIFLTTGSRQLKAFKTEPALRDHRLIARVLPEPAVLTECIQLGFTPRDIVALQGPFSHELNVALFKAYGAEVIITKNSGKIGGSDTKFTAAVELNLPLVVVDRPVVNYSTVVSSVDEVMKYINKEDF